MKFIAITQKGVTKTKSDDRILLNNRILCEDFFYSEDFTPLRIAIADGVGGNCGGDLASEFVCEHLLSGTISENALMQINDDLLEYARTQSGCEQMATTLSGIEVAEQNRVFHIGNSRVYTIRHGYLQQLTIDHTTVQLYQRIGEVEIPEHVNCSEIYRCFGGGDSRYFRPDFYDLKSNSGILLTSDGIHDHLDIDTMEEIIADYSDLQECAKEMVQRAVQNGSQDDISILIINP